MRRSKGSALGQTAPPAVVGTDGQKHISAVVLDSFSEEPGGSANVEILNQVVNIMINNEKE